MPLPSPSLLRLASAALVAAAALALAPDADAAVGFGPCGPGTVGGPEVRCGELEVPLDRADPAAGTVRLHVERIRARGRRDGAVFALNGGPGQSASAFVQHFAGQLEPVLAHHDLVVFDQRGTGLSGALRCWPFASDDIRGAYELAAATAACAAALGSDVRHYTTSAAIDDLDAVREALGYERVSLYGVSYGTQAAIAYARRYPDRVERLVLDSVYVPDADPYRKGSFAAIRRILKELCRRACDFTDDPVGELATLVDRIATDGPLAGPVVGGDGRPVNRRIGRNGLLDLLFAGDFPFPYLRLDLPAAIHAALGGDPAPLLRLERDAEATDDRSRPRDFSDALFHATYCGDFAAPWSAGASPAERRAALIAAAASVPGGTFAPFGPSVAARFYWDCVHWPTGHASAQVAGTLPDVPALVLAGRADVRTPLENARSLATRLPRATVLAVPQTGHAVLSTEPGSCGKDAVAALFAGRPVQACRPVHREGFGPTAAFPQSLADVVPLRGRGGRLAGAARRTLEDVVRQLDPAWYRSETRDVETGDWTYLRGGGLRGGVFTVTPSRLTLRGVEVVPGVRVSGRLRGEVFPGYGIWNARGTLRVTGPGGPITLQVRDSRLRGARIDGFFRG